jgi:hypothetical protein
VIDPRHSIMWEPLEQAYLGPVMDHRSLKEFGRAPKFDALVGQLTQRTTEIAYLRALIATVEVEA